MALKADFVGSDVQKGVHFQHHNDLAARVNELTGMTLIEKITLAVDTNAAPGTDDILFASIPQTFTCLKLYVVARVANPTIRGNLRLQFNSDNAANYDAIIGELFDDTGTGQENSFGNAGPPNNIRIGNFPGDAAGSGVGACSMAEVLIPFYSNSSFHKLVKAETICDSNPQYGATVAAGHGPQYDRHGGRWFNTAAITDIRVIRSSGEGTTAIKAGSSFALYGF